MHLLLPCLGHRLQARGIFDGKEPEIRGSIIHWFQRRKLLKALLGHDAEARSKAADSLSKNGWKPKTPEEQAAFLVGTWKLDEAAALGPVATRFFGMTMVKSKPFSRVEIAEILGELADPNAVPYLLETIREGDCWVTVSGTFLCTEASRGVVNRMGSVFPGFGSIGGMIDMGGARVEVRKACEDALVAIANRGANIMPELARQRNSGPSWMCESLANVEKRLAKK